MVAVCVESAQPRARWEDGRVSVGAHRVRLEVPCGRRVVLCQHPDGHYTVLAQPPEADTKPVILFTDRPR